MNREELVIALNSVINQGENLSTVIYAVMKGTNEVKLLNIVNTEMLNLQNLYVDSIRNSILDVEGQNLVNVSEADERNNTIFEYDLEFPESLEYFSTELNDQLPIFSFRNDDLTNIESLLIEIGTEQGQLTLLKHLSTVEVFGRGGYLFWNSNERLDKFKDKVLRFTPKFHGIKIDDSYIFIDLKVLERSHGFHEVIVKEAKSSIQKIENMDLLDTTEGLTDLLSNISFARKVLKIKNSPVINNKIPNDIIIDFTKTHPALKNKMKYNDDNTKIILKTKRSKNLFVKMLDDVFLSSELTKQYYESKAKDAVNLENEDNEEENN